MTDLAERVDELLKVEKWSEAIHLLEAHFEVVRNNARLVWNHGWALLKLGRAAEAVEKMHRAVQLDPDNPVAWWGLANCERSSGDIRSAEEHYRKALGMRDSYLARLNLATMLLEAGRPAEAEAVHRQGVSLRPDHRERLEALADLLEDIGNLEEAHHLRKRAEVLPTREERRSGSKNEH